jgi:hypothetical protein
MEQSPQRCERVGVASTKVHARVCAAAWLRAALQAEYECQCFVDGLHLVGVQAAG